MTQSTSPPITQQQVSLLWAVPENASEIARIQADIQTQNWGEEFIRELLNDPCSNSLLAKIRLQPENPPATAGYIMGRIAADEVEILSIGVLTPFQKFGVGRQLVEGLFRAARRAEAANIFLEVAVDNASAIALYNKLGFNETGRRTGYYKNADGTAVDALILSYAL